jgi:hypothetical protein
VSATNKKLPVKALAIVGDAVVKGWLISRNGDEWYWRDTDGGNLWTRSERAKMLNSDRGIYWALGWDGEEADAFRAMRGLVS